MSQISAADVKRLREMTGVAMMDCKKALETAAGDFDKAIEILRTKGQATAKKRAGKAAAEGACVARTRGKLGVNVELNCETDFVARNEDFRKLLSQLADLVLDKRPKSIDELAKLTLPGGTTVASTIEEKTGSIGEKIVARRFDLFEAKDGFVQEYVHMEGRIGVLVEIAGVDGSAEPARVLAKDVAMHIAAMSPPYLERSQVPASEVAKEKEIQKQRALEEGKPADKVEKIAEGRLNKFYGEMCLLDQPFVKDQKKTVQAVVDETGKKLGKTLKVTRFSRFRVGEGVEAAAEE